jgi:hypothetical protein
MYKKSISVVTEQDKEFLNLVYIKFILKMNFVQPGFTCASSYISLQHINA